MKKQHNLNKSAVCIILFLCLALGASLTAILHPTPYGAGYTADIYQDGELLTSIPLDGSGAPYRFTVVNESGGTNEIEVRSHSIGILSADCPDKLCVHQGFIERPGLPIVCLPNRLVIQLREEAADPVDATAR